MNRFPGKSVNKFSMVKPFLIGGRQSRRFFIIALVVMFVSLPALNRAQAAVGDLDLTFGTGGRALVPMRFGRVYAYGAALQPDGKIVLGGAVQGNEGELDSELVRYNYDGSLDLSFGSAGRVKEIFSASDDVIYAVAVQSDGKIVTAGDGFNAMEVARFNPNGSRDLTFARIGHIRVPSALSTARAMALQTDGKIVVVGGGRGPLYSNYDFVLARLNTDGSLDTSFGTNGIVLTDFEKTDQAYSMVIQPDGRIVVGGTASSVSDNFFALARYNTDGTLDNSFGLNGKVTTNFFTYSGINSIALAPDNKIVAAGYVGTVVVRDCALVRYNSDGSLDNTFDFDGMVTTDFSGNTDELRNIIVQPDGRILASGRSYQNNSDFALFRYNLNGSLDTSFGVSGRILTDFSGMNDYPHELMIQPLGEIVVTGYSLGSIGSSRLNFSAARYKGDGPYDLRLQDENTGNTLKLNSVTGEYQFKKCGGITLGGTGTVKQRGCTITLEHNLADRRTAVKVDTCQNKGSASVQLLSSNAVFSISDRNIRSTNTVCP
jgi:uncharacterized delta-60 repeat protein